VQTTSPDTYPASSADFTLYLAWFNCLQPTIGRAAGHRPLNYLVSYVYAGQFQKERHLFDWGRLSLDSGAFTVWNKGESIDLQDYIAFARDFGADEVFALDVIGDHRASRRNADAMMEAGIPCIPTYHVGEPEGALKELARDFPKIAIGGVARGAGKGLRRRFVEEVFARVWPKKIHGFALTDDDLLRDFPFHSVDSSSWNLAPRAFGQWKSYDNLKVPGIVGAHYDLWGEVDIYLRREQMAQRLHRRTREAAFG
jgi:hypothetical protein